MLVRLCTKLGASQATFDILILFATQRMISYSPQHCIAGAALPKQPTVPGTGRRLPRTPMQSAIPVHHTPLLPRKRELPTKPMSLDLRHSNRDLLLRAAAGTVGRLSNRDVVGILYKCIVLPAVEPTGLMFVLGILKKYQNKQGIQWPP